MSRLVLHRGDAFSGAGLTDCTVTSQGHRIAVHRVNVRQAVGQFHSDQTSLVVRTNPLVGLNERRVHNWLLETQTRKKNHLNNFSPKIFSQLIQVINMEMSDDDAFSLPGVKLSGGHIGIIQLKSNKLNFFGSLCANFELVFLSLQKFVM